MKRLALFALGIVLVGCPAKDKKGDTPAASASAVASATPSAAPASTDAVDPAAAAAQAGTQATGGVDVPGVSTDPNGSPSHDDHDKTAVAQIHKGNYKNEMDKLEKEDLNADKK